MRQKWIIEEVEKVFEELDVHLSSTEAVSGLKCPDFCGMCCRKADIEASPIEFMPLAAWLYQTGKVNDFLTRLDHPKHGWCVCFDPDAASKGEWGCQFYEKRGLICRLFGFGFRLNRENLPVLVTCKIMKCSQSAAVTKAGEMAAVHPEEMPIFSNYFMRLLAIDPDLAVPQMPINDAIRVAIEKLYFYYLDKEEDEH
ncbi:MAG: YkgJ family cysteine cluster protein [Bacteroidia bacterium]|nr:YkgJ family cysteine cluster protein [Bacteroidia bacterium]